MRSTYGSRVTEALRKGEEVAFAPLLRWADSLYGDQIAHELALIEQMDPVWRTGSAMVFSVLSPQADFTFNSQATQPVLRELHTGINRFDLADLILSHGLGLQNEKADRLIGLRPLIVDGVLPSWLDFQDYVGIGPKVASMAHHLCNEWAPSATLDRHMLRIFSALSGVTLPNRIHFGTYCTLMTWFLDATERLLPQKSPFLAQWALWDTKFAEFTTHLPIFGLESDKFAD